MSDVIPSGRFLLYVDEAGRSRIDVRFDGDTVWLTQAQLVELFESSKANIGEHISNILAEGELVTEATVRDFRTVRQEGSRQVQRSITHYNLDMIISVGYRVKSRTATAFRIWATERLREYIVKGFVLDDERLANPDLPFDYFDELLERIQAIRTSERRFYQKITDVYATSIDYDADAGLTQTFFATEPRMTDWITKLDGFLTLNDRDILTGAGKISHALAVEQAKEQFRSYSAERPDRESDFDRFVRQVHTNGIDRLRRCSAPTWICTAASPST